MESLGSNEPIPKASSESEIVKLSTEEIIPEPEIEKPKSKCNQDCILALLTSFGLFVIMGMRCNLGPGFDILYDKDFSWIPTEVVLIDGAFHVGYILIQIPAAKICYKYSPNNLFIAGVIASAFVNLVLPGAVNLGSEFLTVLRFFQGGFEGLVIPALFRVWGLTISETKASLIAIAFSGCLLGFAFSFPLSRYLSWSFSWEATFYFFGGLAIVWSLIWSYFVSDKSSTLKDEKFAVIVPIITEQESISIPSYYVIFKSRPLWALSSVTTSCLLSVYIFITTLNIYTPSPQYHFFTNEFTFSVLCIIIAVALIITGFGSDFLFHHNILSLITIRKITICASVCLLLPISLITVFTRESVLVTSAYSCCSFLFGCAICGILVNCLDLGKQHAALSSAFISFCSFSACMIIYIMKVQFSTHEKSIFSFIVFIAIVQIFGVFIYAVYGSAEDQLWDMPAPLKELDEKIDEKTESELNCEETEPKQLFEKSTIEPEIDKKVEETEVERLPVITEGVEYHHVVETKKEECGITIEETDGESRTSC